ncbi:MAG: hypothetical protein ACTS27_08640 [Phycisphaerales bacterium]
MDMTDESAEHTIVDARQLEWELRARPVDWIGYLILAAVLLWVPLALGWEHLVAAWPRLGFMRVGVFGFALGLSVLALFATAFIQLVRGRARRELVCPHCFYTIAERWDREPSSVVQCPECGLRFWMWDYMTVASPSARVFVWSFTLRHRRWRLAAFALMACVVCGLGAGAAMAQRSNETPFNITGASFGAAIIGLLLALAAVDLVLARKVDRWADASVCPEGHAGFRRDVGPQRSLCWCGACHDGWWIPTRRDDLLHAVADEIARERALASPPPAETERD